MKLGSGRTITHRFAKTGAYTIVLVIKLPDGHTRSSRMVVRVR